MATSNGAAGRRLLIAALAQHGLETLSAFFQHAAGGAVTRVEGALREELGLAVDDISDGKEALVDSDLFVAIGTSGSVYPAAGLVEIARETGVPTAELNLEPSDNAWAFSERRYGPASRVVPAFVDELAGGLN